MSDELPPWVRYVNEKADKLGLELSQERTAREVGDKELADDITKITTSRMARWSWWARWAVGLGVTAIVGGAVTLAIFYIEALSHLPGGTP